MLCSCIFLKTVLTVGNNFIPSYKWQKLFSNKISNNFSILFVTEIPLYESILFLGLFYLSIGVTVVIFSSEGMHFFSKSLNNLNKIFAKAGQFLRIILGITELPSDFLIFEFRAVH